MMDLLGRLERAGVGHLVDSILLLLAVKDLSSAFRGNIGRWRVCLRQRKGGKGEKYVIVTQRVEAKR